MSRWPKAVLQFEDFSTDNAKMLLDRYRGHHCMFNDDIQGTAATALAGMYGAMRVMGKPKSAIKDQTFVVCGAGSAGMGVISMIMKAMLKHGLTDGQAQKRFWVLDGDGLITTKRADIPAHVLPFARADEHLEGLPLKDVIQKARPTVMLGLTGAGPIWTQDVLETFGSVAERPVIFPMSNPTSKMECTAQEAQTATKGRAIFASGSPQPAVTMDDKMILSSQANNMFIFPGLALGAYLANAATISEAMLMVAAEAIPDQLPEHVVNNSGVYPKSDNIRELSAHVALAVIKQAIDEGSCKDPKMIARVVRKSKEDMITWIGGKMYKPVYGPIVHLPPGINE